MTDTSKNTTPDCENVIPFVPDDEVEDYVVSIRRAMEGWSPPSNERWMELMNPLLPTLRIAHMTLVRLNCCRGSPSRLAEFPDTIKTRPLFSSAKCGTVSCCPSLVNARADNFPLPGSASVRFFLQTWKPELRVRVRHLTGGIR
jgi:hypothetical protein